MAEYDRSQLESALIAADKAGNVEDAKALAATIRDLDAQEAPTPDAPIPAPTGEEPAVPGVLPFMQNVAPVAPAALPTEPSGFVPSIGMGGLSGAQAASTFFHETAKNNALKRMKMTMAREDQGLPVHPAWSRENIRKSYQNVLSSQGIVEETLQPLMEAIEYQPAEWDDNKAAWISQTIGQAVGSMAPILATGPAAPLTGYMMAGGGIIEELKDVKTLTQAEKIKIAQVGGVPMAALERLGLGAIFGKIGGTGAKKMAVGAGGEAITELLQEMGVIGIGAAYGKEYEAGDITERAMKALVGGAGAGPLVSIPKAVSTALGQRSAEANIQGVYGDNADQMASDQRVYEAFEAKLASMREAGTDLETKPAWILRTIASDMNRTVRTVVKSLQDTGVLEKEDVANINAILAKAHKGVNVLDQDDFDVIFDLPVENGIKKPLANALRDINAAIGGSRDIRTVGPAEKYLSGGAQHLAGAGMVGRVVPGGRQIIGGSLRTVGRYIDTIMESRVPRVLQGAGARGRLVARAKGEVSDPGTELKAFYQRVKKGERVTTSERQAVIDKANKMRAKLRLLDRTGVGSFDSLIAETTGLNSAQVDDGLMRLLMAGDIDIEQHAAFYVAPDTLKAGKQGLMIMDMLNALDMTTPTADEAAAGAPAASNIRNQVAYNATVRSAEVARDAAYQAINEAGIPPEQAQSLIGLTDQIVQIKNKSEKRALLATALQGMPKPLADIVKKVISPLADYGSLDPAIAAKVEKAVNK